MINLYEVRRLAEEAAQYLKQRQRASVSTQRALISDVTALANEVEQLQKQLAEAEHWRVLYTDLSADWSAVCTAVEAAGIDVVNPFIPGEPIPVWVWKCADGATGTAQTAGQAMAAGIMHALGNS